MAKTTTAERALADAFSELENWRALKRRNVAFGISVSDEMVSQIEELSSIVNRLEKLDPATIIRCDNMEIVSAAKRITKSRDPILSALRAEYLAALGLAPNASLEQWHAATDRVNKARVAVNKREELYTPKRERKARRKNGELSRWGSRLAKGPQPKNPLSTMYFAREMRRIRNHLDTLQNRNVHPQMRDEFINETKTCLFWARHHRTQAAALGRRIP